jgi:GT2 family glycosyltransferase
MRRDEKMKTMIAVPCMDSVQTEFCRSLCDMKKVGTVQHAFHSCSLIYQARTDLGRLAVSQETDFCLWLDSDVVFPDTLMEDLMADMEGRDIVTGIYHMRRPPYMPVIWEKLRMGLTQEDKESIVITDYPDDEMFEVEGCGFGAVLMRTKVLKDVIDRYNDLFAPLPGYGEDLSFCLRARGCGYKIWCDPRIQVGHKSGVIVSKDTFEAYRQKVGGKLV